MIPSPLRLFAMRILESFANAAISAAIWAMHSQVRLSKGARVVAVAPEPAPKPKSAPRDARVAGIAVTTRGGQC